MEGKIIFHSWRTVGGAVHSDQPRRNAAHFFILCQKQELTSRCYKLLRVGLLRVGGWLFFLIYRILLNNSGPFVQSFFGLTYQQETVLDSSYEMTEFESKLNATQNMFCFADVSKFLQVISGKDGSL